MKRRTLQTNAPAAYDYDGTYELGVDADGVRTVTVHRAYATYQIDRYLSGLYFVKEPK